MDRNELVASIRRFLRNPNIQWKGEKTFAEYFHWWFDTQVTEDFPYSGILPHLPEIIVEAVQHLREGQDVETIRFRTSYLNEVQANEVPNLTDIAFGGVRRVLTIEHLAGMMPKLTGNDFTEHQLKAYLHAQDNMLDHSLREFIRQVYRRGMYQLTHECDDSGMGGQFGTTELRTFYTAGHLMLTFARPNQDMPDGEESVSYVADYEDPTGLRSGVQSVFTSVFTAIEMINEVIANWPQTLEEQAKAYSSNSGVRIAGL